MDDRTESTDIQKQGKFSNWKRKGKLSELDRLKKRQKELQIMKLSQEWDARRHKRKMDRIQWLQQRKDQVVSQNESTEATKTTDEAGDEGQRANQSVPSKANNSPLSSYSTQENSYEITREVLSKPISNVNTDRPEENTSNLCKVSRASSAENESSICSPPNQVYKSVVVKTERLDSDRFSNSNYTSVSRQSNSRNYSHIPADNRKRRKKDTQDIRIRTDHLELHPTVHPAEGKLGSSAYESLVNLVNSQPPVGDIIGQPSSVIAQAMKQSGLDEEEVHDEDMDDEEPSLLMASEPVRFEEVLQRGGTNIQRLPTRSVEIMSNNGTSKQQNNTDKVHTHTRPRSRDSIEDLKAVTRQDDHNPAYPKIKQCYSLMGQESKNSTPLHSPSSTHTGSPVATIACSSNQSSTVNIEGRSHPVAQTSTANQSCPPSGYLVPVYKPSADEVVYAFVPSTGDRVHPGHLRASDIMKTSSDSAVYPPIDQRHQGHAGFSTIRPPTAIIHHGRGINSPLERVEYSKKITSSYQPTNVTWVNAQSTSEGEKRDYQSKGVHTAFPTVREVPVSSSSGAVHRHGSYHKVEVIKTRQNPDPVVTMANGYSPTPHNAPHATDSVNNGQGLRSSPLTNPDTINNPTAVYVRPRLVPREIIVPYHAGSGNVPIVEYIKTDVICDKDLSNWTSQNVAEFISATDCSESAKIFIEQDIDGKAVLLLSQDIFVNRLNLKLGTAIKLYNHVANLRSALLM